MNYRHLTMNHLAELTGMDRRTVKKKLGNLKVHKGDGNGHYYDTLEALPILFSVESGDSINKQMNEEALRHERAKREKVELQNGKMRGELIPIGEVASVVERQYSVVRATIRTLPSKLAKTLSLISDPHEVHALLSEAVDECLVELTADETYEQQRADIESIDDSSSVGSSEVSGSESSP